MTRTLFFWRYEHDQNVKEVELSRAGAQSLDVHKVRKTQNCKDVPHRSAIFETQRRSQLGNGLLATLEATSPTFLMKEKETPIF